MVFLAPNTRGKRSATRTPLAASMAKIAYTSPPRPQQFSPQLLLLSAQQRFARSSIRVHLVVLMDVRGPRAALVLLPNPQRQSPRRILQLSNQR